MRDVTLAPGELRNIDDQDVRLQHRVKVLEGETGVGSHLDTQVGLVVDVETTGLRDDDVIIELALRRFRSDPDGLIVKIDRPYSWLEDPGRPLSPRVVELTGLTDGDLAGKAIDDAAAVRLLQSADYICAHNAKFDRMHIERRLPEAAGLAWACSCGDIDWQANGIDCAKLVCLLPQLGLFHEAHRAADDVDAVIALLQRTLPGGRTALSEMLSTARAPSWRFRAVGAAYEVKDQLSERGYRWDAQNNPNCWCREVSDECLTEEERWLASHIYSADARPKALGPIIQRVTWLDRYAPAPCSAFRP